MSSKPLPPDVPPSTQPHPTHQRAGRRRRTSDDPYVPPLLRILYQAFIQQLHDDLAAAGYPDIRPTHGIVFQHLREGGSRVTELAERSQVSKQWMGSLVDDLEQRGYLMRVPDPGDGRAKLVCVTDKGRELLRVAQEASRRVEAQWSARLGARRLRELRRRLLDAIDTLELNDPTPRPAVIEQRPHRSI